MVKSAYSIFKDNMSNGVTVTVNPTGEVLPPATANWKIELNGNYSMTVQQYYDFVNAGNKPVKVIDNGYDVTSGAHINNSTCFDSNNNEVSCLTMDCNERYTIQHSVTYNNKTKVVTRELTAGC